MISSGSQHWAPLSACSTVPPKCLTSSVLQSKGLCRVAAFLSRAACLIATTRSTAHLTSLSVNTNTVLYIYKYVFYSLKHNNSFILFLKLHKTRATSFGVLLSSGPSEKLRIDLKIKMLCACNYIDTQLLFFKLMGSHFTILD